MGETLQLYVKMTSNCPDGLPLTAFEVLGETWQGDSIMLPFGDPAAGPVKVLKVVGWTDLFTGRPCRVSVVKAWAPDGSMGYLVYGGNSGVRILDPLAEPEPWAEHLPPGYGRPLVWLEDPADLPREVLAVIEPEARQVVTTA